MMKALLFCLLSFAGAAQADPVILPEAEQIALHSVRTGGDYRILVARPPAPAPAGGYPVIYVLDADIYFNTVVETLRIQSRRPQATGVMPALIVGITYPIDDNIIERRMLDYTPTSAAVPVEGMNVKRAGGADAFLAFIDEELRPTIVQHYPIDAQRQAIFGHSLGGLFVLHALLTRPAMFSHYIAASPSWWWNAAAMSRQEAAFVALPDETVPRRALLLTAGELEQKPSRFSDNMPGGIGALTARRMVDNANELAGRLQGVHGLRVTWLEIADENHLSSVPQAINRGLRFALEP